MVDKKAASVLASSKVAAVCELVDNIIPSQTKKKKLKKNRPNKHKTNKGERKLKYCIPQYCRGCWDEFYAILSLAKLTYCIAQFCQGCWEEIFTIQSLVKLSQSRFLVWQKKKKIKQKLKGFSWTTNRRGIIK